MTQAELLAWGLRAPADGGPFSGLARTLEPIYMQPPFATETVEYLKLARTGNMKHLHVACYHAVSAAHAGSPASGLSVRQVRTIARINRQVAEAEAEAGAGAGAGAGNACRVLSLGTGIGAGRAAGERR